MTVDRLTALDASFVWFERPGVPIHVGAVATFEAAPLLDGSGRLRLAELREHIAGRLDALPRLRRRLASVPFDLDRPRWVDDPDFDIAHHVGEVRLPSPGDDAALRRVAGDLQGQMLPRDRPLWDLHFVTGLSGDRVGLVERIHHALVDGVSGVELATLLLDLDPDAPAPPPPPRWSPAPPPDPLSLFAAGLRDRLADPVRAAGALAGLALHPARAAQAAGTVARGLGTMVDQGLLAPRTSLNAPLAGGRTLAWVRARLDDVRAAGRAVEASVNDVVLTAVAGGLRWLFLERGERLPPDLVLKVLVPVSLHGADEHGTLGNRVSAVYAPLPVGIGDPQARLAAVAASMRRLKAQPEADSMGLVLDAANGVPAGVARLIARAVDHQRFVNLVVTNVPGPPVPLFACGARMLEAFPVVPLDANMTVGVAVLSYDGTLTISLTADDLMCPDVDVFAAGIERSLAQLGVAAAEPRRASACATTAAPRPVTLGPARTVRRPCPVARARPMIGA
jgi:WS/DGAT/MGAT family acyltransferase